MAIVIQTPKGPVEFPDGTPKEVIQAQVRKASGFKEPVRQREVYNYQDPNAGNFMNSLLRGATFDFADEAMGGIATTYAKMHDLITGKDSGITYADAVESVRQDQEAFAERNPGLNLAGELIGGIGTGGLGAYKTLGTQAVKQAPKLTKALAIPAVAGAEGFVSGLGQGEDLEERLTLGGQQGLLAAGTGGLLDRVGQKVANRWLRKEADEIAEKAVPERVGIKQVKKDAQEFYDQAEKAGVVIDTNHFQNFRAGLMNDLGAEGIDTDVYPQIGKAMRKLAKTETPTYKDIANIQRMLKNARRSGDPDVKRVANTVNAHINKFVADLKPGNIAGGDVTDLSANVNKARELWRARAQLDITEEIQDAAELSSTALSGNLDEAINTQIRPILKRYRKGTLSLDDDIAEGLESIVKGTRGKNIARAIGEVDPSQRTQRGLFPSLGAAAVGVALTGSPAGVIAGVIPGISGKIAKNIANKMTKQELEALNYALLNRGRPESQEIIDAIMEPFRPMISGVAAGTAGATADEQQTTLQDMMQ